MAKFLNTDLLNEWILRLIEETERELIIIVPYIKTSGRVYKQLFEANKRGVETTIVYRENQLTPVEKKKFEALDNLNLMHHPNIHAKCYYNEKYMIIGSMNLYEYSEKNNREMGVLLHRVEIEENNGFGSNADDDTIFEDAIKEMQTIIKSSTFEKQSRETRTEGFEIDIIKTQKEIIEEDCKILNKVFLHKKFAAKEVRGMWQCVCENYFDHIDVLLEYRRAAIDFDYKDDRVNDIFKRVIPNYHELRFEGYKFYWNGPKSSIYLYPNRQYKMWENLPDGGYSQLMKNGIDQVITFLRPFI
jgi:hypothetical protein